MGLSPVTAQGTLDWAERHLAEFERLVSEYVASHPYEALPPVQNDKRGRWYLHFTAQPDPDLAFILGDFLYNVRAALDYVASAIAPSSNRSRVNFPILWQGVWEPGIQGEDKQLSDDRRAWKKFESAMRSRKDAISVIKQCQPDKPTRYGSTHTLAMLNRLRNKDTHERINLVAHRLVGPIHGWVTSADGARRSMVATNEDGSSMGPGDGLEDGACIGPVPADTVDVEVHGTPAVVVRLGMDDDFGYAIRGMRDLIMRDARLTIDALRQFDLRTP